MTQQPQEPDAVNTLSVDSVSFSFGVKAALNQVTFSVQPGETVFLLGPNGAGKSTLFSLISGLYKPTSGTVSVSDANAGTPKALSQLGIVFQSDTLDPDLSIADNLHYYAALHGLSTKIAHERIAACIAPFELSERLKEKVRTLNGGHRRRVDIARALMHQPRLLLLDEPTVGLDIPTRSALTQRLQSLASTLNCAVLWATHLADEVRDSDRIVLLHEGSIHGDANATKLMQSFQSRSVEEMMNAVMLQTTAINE